MRCLVRLSHDSNRSAGSPEENAVRTACRAGACSTCGEARQHVACFIVEPHSAGLLRASRVNGIFSQNKLQVSDVVGPLKFSVDRRSDDHLLSLRAREKQQIFRAFHVARRGVAGDVMLSPLVRADGCQQVLILVSPKKLASLCVNARQKMFRAADVDFVILHADGSGVEEFVISVMPETLAGFSIQCDESSTVAKGGARVFIVVPFPHAPRPVAETSAA